jgi:hypothetical protein
VRLLRWAFRGSAGPNRPKHLGLLKLTHLACVTKTHVLSCLAASASGSVTTAAQPLDYQLLGCYWLLDHWLLGTCYLLCAMWLPARTLCELAASS